jgi:hypothetical protein
MLLRHALANPDNISALLLFQLQVGIKDSKAELSHEGIDVQLDIIFEEFIFDCFIRWICAHIFEQWLVLLK